GRLVADDSDVAGQLDVALRTLRAGAGEQGGEILGQPPLGGKRARGARHHRAELVGQLEVERGRARVRVDDVDQVLVAVAGGEDVDAELRAREVKLRGGLAPGDRAVQQRQVGVAVEEEARHLAAGRFRLDPA